MSTFKEQGNKAFQAKDYAGAINFYGQALAENPADHTILGNRSAAFYQLKQYDNAMADANQCIALQPDWSKGYQRKAMTLQATGKLDEAIEQYRVGVEKDASNAQCKQLLERAEEEQAMQMMGSMGGMPGMGMGMPGMGGGDGPFSKAALERIKTNPKFAAYF